MKNTQHKSLIFIVLFFTFLFHWFHFVWALLVLCCESVIQHEFSDQSRIGSKWIWNNARTICGFDFASKDDVEWEKVWIINCENVLHLLVASSFSFSFLFSIFPERNEQFPLERGMHDYWKQWTIWEQQTQYLTLQYFYLQKSQLPHPKNSNLATPP